MKPVSVAIASLFLTTANAQTTAQAPLGEHDRQPPGTNSFEIFNELNGLLRQWGNALRPNGFSVTLASVPSHTLLYHARTDPDEPASPEWFALDPEMSYGIYGGRQNTSVFLRTYRTSFPLDRLLYFNGLSAALTFSGTLDSQELLAPSNNSPFDPFGDYARAERLCAWAKDREIKGFVRTNAGFEILLCDLTKWGLELVRNVDVTRWADEMDDHSDRKGSDRDGEGRRPGPPHPPPSPPSPNEPPPDFPDGPFPDKPHGHPRFPGPPPGRSKLFAQYASWEWLRAASHTYDGIGEARIQLYPGWHVTAHGISGSGSANRMASLSNETINSWRAEVNQMVHESNQGMSSSIDWRGVTDMVISRYGDRLLQLKDLLSLVYQDAAYTPPTNASTHLKHAHRLVSSLLLPFYDWDASREEQIDLCTKSVLLPSLDSVNKYERKLWTAIVHVHTAICTTLVDTHSELAALRPYHTHKADSKLVTMAERIEALVEQLDWSVWVRCPEVCPWGQVCYIPIWPLFGFGTQNQTLWPWLGRGGGRPEPQCAGALT